jgi:hypothetical protein
MKRCALYALIGAACSLAGACVPPQAACASSANCPSGDTCRAGQCVVLSAPTIRVIDGDGTARSPLPRHGVDVPEGALAAARRTRGGAVLTGTNLDGVDTCRFEQGGASAPCEFTDIAENGGTVRPILLPEFLVPGLVTLVIGGAAGEARAQVFLLQGEQGPPGVDVAVALRDAGDACPLSGVIIATGQDANGDGVLEPGEEQSERPLCADLQGAVDCSGGVCNFSSPITAPALSVSGRNVVTALPTNTVMHVPGDAATIAEALDRVRDVAIPLGTHLFIRLAAGTHVVPEVIVVQHPDGLRISISGAGRDLTTIEAPAGFLEVQTALGSIDGMTIEGDGDLTGINVGPTGARLHVGRDVTIRQFSFGLFVFDGGVTGFSPGDDTGRALLLDNTFGATAAHGYIEASGIEVRNSAIRGVWSASGFVQLDGSIISGPAECVHSESGGIILAKNVDASQCQLAFDAVGGAYLEAHGATAGNAPTPFRSLAGSTISALGVSFTGTPSVDASSFVITQ